MRVRGPSNDTSVVDFKEFLFSLRTLLILLALKDVDTAWAYEIKRVYADVCVCTHVCMYAFMRVCMHACVCVPVRIVCVCVSE